MSNIFVRVRAAAWVGALLLAASAPATSRAVEPGAPGGTGRPASSARHWPGVLHAVHAGASGSRQTVMKVQGSS
jgi:hypothetical protein